MSDFKAKMQQIQFRLGLRPDSVGAGYSAPPNPLAGFKGERKGGEGVDGVEGPHYFFLWIYTHGQCSQ